MPIPAFPPSSSEGAAEDLKEVVEAGAAGSRIGAADMLAKADTASEEVGLLSSTISITSASTKSKGDKCYLLHHVVDFEPCAKQRGTRTFSR